MIVSHDLLRVQKIEQKYPPVELALAYREVKFLMQNWEGLAVISRKEMLDKATNFFKTILEAEQA